MKRTAIAVLLCATAFTAFAGQVRTEVDLYHREFNGHFLSAGHAEYQNFWGTSVNEPLTIYHYIENTDATFMGDVIAPYTRTIESSEPGTPPNCYRAHLDASADDSSAGAGTSEICLYGPPAPGGDNPPPLSDCDGQTNCTPNNSPIVINFAPGGYALSGANAPVSFDINATGTKARIGWTAAGADEAFLWLDRNGNGKVDDGSELFGTATRLATGATAANGFAALAELDENRDGTIDAQDSGWTRLRLWRDANHDGVSDSGELSNVTDSRLVGIALKYAVVGRRDSFGNLFRYQSLVSLRNSSNVPRHVPVYDIFFVDVP